MNNQPLAQNYSTFGQRAASLGGPAPRSVNQWIHKYDVDGQNQQANMMNSPSLMKRAQENAQYQVMNGMDEATDAMSTTALANQMYSQTSLPNLP